MSQFVGNFEGALRHMGMRSASPCSPPLASDGRRLEALDGCLGEYRNVIVLERILMKEAAVVRGDTMRGLRVLRRSQLELRHRAAGLGGRALAETPRAFTARVRRLWRAGPTRRVRPRRTSWQRAAPVRNADVIFVLDEGRIVQSGTHDQLARGGLYDRLYHLQFHVDDGKKAAVAV